MVQDKNASRLVEQLQQAIRDSKLSLNELGRRTGVSQGQLSRFLRGDRTLTLPAAARVCDYFGLELCVRHNSGVRPGASTESKSDGQFCTTSKATGAT